MRFTYIVLYQGFLSLLHSKSLLDQHDKLMFKMTILFLLWYTYVYIINIYNISVLLFCIHRYRCMQNRSMLDNVSYSNVCMAKKYIISRASYNPVLMQWNFLLTIALEWSWSWCRMNTSAWPVTVTGLHQLKLSWLLLSDKSRFMLWYWKQRVIFICTIKKWSLLLCYSVATE